MRNGLLLIMVALCCFHSLKAQKIVQDKNELSIAIGGDYAGWFFRNSDITRAEIATVKASNKRIILHDTFSSLSVNAAIDKAPYGLLVEDVVDAVVLARD